MQPVRRVIGCSQLYKITHSLPIVYLFPANISRLKTIQMYYSHNLGLAEERDSPMRKLALFLASVLIIANGCVISPRRTVGSTSGGGNNSEFSLSANPTSQIVTAGASATFTITVSAVNGFTGTVSLNASSSNSNIVAGFDNTTITGGSGSAVLTVTTTSA